MTRAEIEGLCERLTLMADQGDFGRPPDPTDVRRRAATALRAMLAREQAMREALEFVDKYLEPWGSWKTAWWEAEVSDDAAFSDNNALKHVANILRRPTRHLAQGAPDHA